MVSTELGAILDDWKSVLIAFLTISDQYATFIFLDIFSQNGCGHFGWSKITFDHISHYLGSPTLKFCDFFLSQNEPKISFYWIFHHFRSIHNFFLMFFNKITPAAILDDRKSLLIPFLAISNQYATLIFFEFFSQNGDHFGWMKITFAGISLHFRSIRNFFFVMFSQNGRRRPFWLYFSIAFLAI